MSAISGTNLTKYYRTSFSFKRLFKEKNVAQRSLAVNDLSFDVKKGELFGLLGPNGAGKTTLMKMIGTILIPDSGRLEVMGYEIPKHEKKVKESIGICLGEYERTFHWRLSGRQNLRFFSTLLGLSGREGKDRADELLALVGLEDKAERMFLEYSTGMKHKLAIARSLLNDPELLLMDEPTAGIDLKTSNEIGNIVRNLSKRGSTILYSTHRIEESGNLCDRIMIMKEGRKLAEESPNDLKRLIATDVVALQLADGSTMPEKDLGELPGVKQVYHTRNSEFRIHCKSVNETLREVMDLVGRKGLKVENLNTSKPTMEDVFLTITEKGGME
ncbi:MAG: daunorubicin ABC transporter ATP-binding protein [Thermoplasmata archaeon HGW-Thermoplasmata-1]|nr:MAG: daunorubicin ABC transporter ATP-binding protein [Thermoplasmata archaeon HGW-Thermoplasmata-1]